MGNVFISYRRTDSADVVGRISDRLRKEFGRESVFVDVDSIALGADFPSYVDSKLKACDAFLAVIGDSWVTSTDDQGRRRLDDPADHVRIEIECALKRNIP